MLLSCYYNSSIGLNASCARTSAICPALGNIQGHSPILCFEQYLKDHKHDSLHLERRYARRFVLGDYLFLAAHGSSLLGTDNVHGQISEEIFAPNGGYITSIWREIMPGYLSADVPRSEQVSKSVATLSENCELRGTDNVQGQISEHIFAPDGGCCVYYFRNAHRFETWGR